MRDFEVRKTNIRRHRSAAGGKRRRTRDVSAEQLDLSGFPSTRPIMEPGIVATQREAAAHFAVSVRTLRSWRESGCPGKRGRYSLAAIADWYEERQGGSRSRNGTAAGAGDPEGDEDGLSYWDTRFRRARARIHELDLQIRSGEAVATSVVHQSFIGRVLEVRRGLMGMGRALGPQVVGLGAREASRVIDKYARELLVEYAREGVPGVSAAESRDLVQYLENKRADDPLKMGPAAAESDSDQASGANGDAA